MSSPRSGPPPPSPLTFCGCQGTTPSESSLERCRCYPMVIPLVLNFLYAVQLEKTHSICHLTDSSPFSVAYMASGMNNIQILASSNRSRDDILSAAGKLCETGEFGASNTVGCSFVRHVNLVTFILLLGCVVHLIHFGTPISHQFTLGLGIPPQESQTSPEHLNALLNAK